jgi:double-stranded uracil-DNA glycosylase
VKAAAARDRCFAPIADRKARTLILGSLPGRKSLEMQQYYAHPQNAFWKLMAALFEWNPASSYAQRVRLLKKNHIAVWDVCAAAERPGSLDSAIVAATANDFATFFNEHPGIDRVFFNGRKSEDIFRRAVLPKLATEFPHITYVGLPSTSPAHAGMSFSKKLARWRAVRAAGN